MSLKNNPYYIEYDYSDKSTIDPNVLATVMQVKQKKYDVESQRLKDFSTQLSNIPLIKDETKKYFADRISTLRSEVEKVGKGVDLSKSGTTDKIMSYLGQAADDIVMEDYRVAKIQENILKQAEDARLKGKGVYSDINLQYSLEGIQNWTKTDLGTRYNDPRTSYIPFTDRIKKEKEVLDNLKAEIKYTTTKNGVDYYSYKNEIIDTNRLKDIFQNTLMNDPEYATQMRVDSWAKYGGVSDEQLTEKLRKNNESFLEAINDEIDFLKLQSKKAKTEKEKEEVATKIEQYEEKKRLVIEESNNIEATVKDNPDSVKQNIFQNEVFSGILSRYKQNNVTDFKQFISHEEYENLKLRNSIKLNQSKLKQDNFDYAEKLYIEGKFDELARYNEVAKNKVSNLLGQINNPSLTEEDRKSFVGDYLDAAQEQKLAETLLNKTVSLSPVETPSGEDYPKAFDNIKKQEEEFKNLSKDLSAYIDKDGKLDLSILDVQIEKEEGSVSDSKKKEIFANANKYNSLKANRDEVKEALKKTFESSGGVIKFSDGQSISFNENGEITYRDEKTLVEGLSQLWKPIGGAIDNFGYAYNVFFSNLNLDIIKSHEKTAFKNSLTDNKYKLLAEYNSKKENVNNKFYGEALKQFEFSADLLGAVEKGDFNVFKKLIEDAPTDSWGKKPYVLNKYNSVIKAVRKLSTEGSLGEQDFVSMKDDIKNDLYQINNYLAKGGDSFTKPYDRKGLEGTEENFFSSFYSPIKINSETALELISSKISEGDIPKNIVDNFNKIYTDLSDKNMPFIQNQSLSIQTKESKEQYKNEIQLFNLGVDLDKVSSLEMQFDNRNRVVKVSGKKEGTKRGRTVFMDIEEQEIPFETIKRLNAPQINNIISITDTQYTIASKEAEVKQIIANGIINLDTANTDYRGIELLSKTDSEGNRHTYSVGFFNPKNDRTNFKGTYIKKSPDGKVIESEIKESKNVLELIYLSDVLMKRDKDMKPTSILNSL